MRIQSEGGAFTYKTPDGRAYYERRYADFHIDYSKQTGDRIAATPLHCHDVGEMMLVESGKCTVIADNDSRCGEAPFIVYYPPRVLHEQLNDCTKGYSRYCFSLAPEYFGGDALALPKCFFILKLTDDEAARVGDFAAPFCKYYSDDRSPANELEFARRKYLLLLLLNELATIISERTTELKSTPYKYICDVSLYINEHYAEKLTLDALAEQFFISRAKLSNDFRAAVNMSVCDYITSVRVNRSKLLLREGLPLSEVAESCGFSSSAYFIRVFKRLNGLTPAVSRAELKARVGAPM